MNKDFMGIVLEVGQESKDPEIRRLYEDVRDGNFGDMSMYNLSGEALNESQSEPLNYHSPKMVKEKYGRGISLTADDTEMRFVSDKYDTGALEHKISYLLEHQEPEQFNDWLKNNTFCYKTVSLNEEVEDDEETSDTEGPVNDDEPIEEATGSKFSTGEIVEYKGKPWVVDDPEEEQGRIRIVTPNKDVAVVSSSDCKKFDGEVSPKFKTLSKKAITSPNRLFEATQTSDVAKKVDQGKAKTKEPSGIKTPVAGKAYEFEDGTFVVDSIDGDTVYLIGPDDEYYSISVEDFKNEVISSIDEAELDEMDTIEASVKSAFKGWAVEPVTDEVDKTGIVLYAVSNGKDDVVVFVHLGEETFEIYSESDEDAPEQEGKLKNLKSALNKVAKYFA